ncbi:monosaccharide ABC transporter ATP-binding protein (CUT2 family) [Roseiarcus fermentans]|uniref:Monosaccharide ABC transporter ATP-binding protein (CUT2 family) n=1 Tax=Roseiarcus fermentans TaxID=1473586 RepID=A0A366EY45_9HYPH|nr:ATP-binding cassette domain-containing protein [Roseiarcus fermentans]RBP07312.1 monosaccharide ABC transporter ATP-binding protein (CUT2 family) [Roseiarcus fermentans]
MDGRELRRDAAAPVDADNAPLMQLRGISKHFGGVTALDRIELKLFPSEIVAIVGDNGAGKSTLIKAISGNQPPDSGTFLFNGKLVEIRTPQDASRVGIETVYQDLALCDNLDTVQNLFLGNEKITSLRSGRRLNHALMESTAREALRDIGVATIRSLRSPVGRLSGGQRQGIAICRCILRDPRVVLLDEPTAALGVEQRQGVVRLIKRLKSESRSVIVISHDLHDVVLEVADRIVVLRLGRKVAEFQRTGINASDLVAAITGVQHFARGDVRSDTSANRMARE